MAYGQTPCQNKLLRTGLREALGAEWRGSQLDTAIPDNHNPSQPQHSDNFRMLAHSEHGTQGRKGRQQAHSQGGLSCLRSYHLLTLYCPYKALQTEATLFALLLTQVSPHSGSTRKRHSQEDVPLHPGVWRCVPLPTLTILKTFLPITFYYTDLNLYLPDYFI